MAGTGGYREGSGRKKGVPNKLNADLKEMILGALSDVGGRDYLALRAVDTPAAFLTSSAKCCPCKSPAKAAARCSSSPACRVMKMWPQACHETTKISCVSRCFLARIHPYVIIWMKIRTNDASASSGKLKPAIERRTPTRCASSGSPSARLTRKKSAARVEKPRGAGMLRIPMKLALDRMPGLRKIGTLPRQSQQSGGKQIRSAQKNWLSFTGKSARRDGTSS